MKYKYLFFTLLIAFSLPVFAQQPDMSLIPYRQGDLWGYASPDKRIVIKPAYAEAHWFVAGYAVVKKGSMYGYINAAGNVVIPFKFFSAKPFRYGYYDKAGTHTADGKTVQNQDTVLFAGATLKLNGSESCIDTKGRVITKCPAINENNAPDINRPTTVTTEASYSTIQKSDVFDKIVGDYKMLGNEDSYYIAMKNNNYGVFNNKFDVIVPFEYAAIKSINISGIVYLVVEKNGMKGVLFGNGSPYVAVDNNNIVHVNVNGKNYFIISRNGKAGIKDAAYHDVIPANYTDILYDNDGGFVLVGNDNLKGFYFLNNYILEPKYTDVRPVRGGIYVMVRTQTGKTGYVNNAGDEFFVE